MNEVFDFGLRLKFCREKCKLTQLQVVQRIGGFSEKSLSSYENNINIPSIDTLKRLALEYHVTTDFLLGLDNRAIIVLDGLNKRQISTIEKVIQLVKMEFKLSERQASFYE